MSDDQTAVLTQSPNGHEPNHDDENVDFVLAHLDEYEKEPKLKRARRVITPFTWILVSLILAAGMFALGAKMGNDHGSTSASGSAIPSNLASLFRNRTGAAGGTGGTGRTATGGTGAAAAGGTGTGRAAGGFGGGGATIGSVKLVDGTNVYVQTTSGGVVKVTTTPSVPVNVTATGSLADLKPGETVTVQGTASADGTSVAATSISQVAAGGFGGGLGGGGGGTGAGTGTGTGTGAGS
jgi:hypothetical protein